MEEKITLLRKAEGSMAMPKKIKIGDPMYFEEGNGLQYTYNKSYRGKADWHCSLEIVENSISYMSDIPGEGETSFNDISFTAYMAYDEKMLSLIKQNKLYSTQKEKVTQLGVDTASYILDINNFDVTIRTGGDGMIGYVCEYYTKTRLDAVVVEVTMPCYDNDNDFDDNKKLLERLFNCKLEEVEIKKVV